MMKRLFRVKRAVSLLLAVCLCLGIWAGGTVQAAGGDGSENNPYLVSTEAELRTAVGKANAYVKLTEDIYVTGGDISLSSGVTLNLDVHTLSFSANSNYRLRIAFVSNVTVKNGMIEGTDQYTEACVDIDESTGVRLENLEIDGNAYQTVFVWSQLNDAEVTLHNCKISNSNTIGATTLAISNSGNEYGVSCTVRATQCDLYPSTYYEDNLSYHSRYSTFFLNGRQVGFTDDSSGSLTAEIGGYSDSWKPITITPESPTGAAEVNHTVPEAYLVTIPEEVTLGESMTLSASGVVLEGGQALSVAITGTSGTDNAFTLENGNGAEINYTVQTSDKTEIKLNDSVLTVDPAISNSGSETLSFLPPDITYYSGSYTGTVTFTVRVS